MEAKRFDYHFFKAIQGIGRDVNRIAEFVNFPFRYDVILAEIISSHYDAAFLNQPPMLTFWWEIS